jgi:uncharacterized surface protein with fasciclin (FAS1) repeats
MLSTKTTENILLLPYKVDNSIKQDGKVMLTDANGGTATVILADVAASNGVIHAIDTVVMPK